MQPGFYWVVRKGCREDQREIGRYDSKVNLWWLCGDDEPYATSDLTIGSRLRGQEERT